MISLSRILLLPGEDLSKDIFNPRVYISTMSQVFQGYGLSSAVEKNTQREQLYLVLQEMLCLTAAHLPSVASVVLKELHRKYESTDLKNLTSPQ